ncbi:hypothetical protein [Kribbella shirazensis]|uniref:WD40 repeat domain-containing protein n=1 Tax=Kribbella shirazensis TaxID=1105143 RepID=A0A7X6A4J3_9ACTN|nr:hypothetical protein [Kribbella shirazensis]NIK61008.1 hypothetical protein [Kribbella shirazensis]
MNDTETRLRDYLQSQAATVPDTAQGPGLDEPRGRQHWPVLATAAAIAAILVLTVTFLTRVAPDKPVPASPVSDAAPKIPYTVYSENALHDGDRKVLLPRGVDGFFHGRVDGGWLGMQLPGGGQSQVGILRPDGSFRELGPQGSDSPTLSPDRKQVAMLHSLTRPKGSSVVVIDIASGRTVARTAVMTVRPSGLLVWNRAGIWLRTDGPVLASLAVWRPGSGGNPRPVRLAEFDGGLRAAPTGGIVAWTTRRGNNRCLKAGLSSEDGFRQIREYCDVGPESIYPVVSPDGRTMVNSQVRVVVDIETGKVTRLQLPAEAEVTTFPEPVFEDANQLILITNPPGNQVKTLTQQLYRCDVRSGECALLQTATGITLQEP